ncbi:MAG: GDSL-type esterase/lipase family protein [Bacteroidia bacterium]
MNINRSSIFHSRLPSRLWVALLSTLLLFACSGSSPENQEKNPAAERSPAESTPETQTSTILFFGNSLTAGYGLEEEEAFPALIQEKLDSAGLEFRVVNAGVSGETSSGGRERIDWALRQHIDIFVLELGANDGLRGIDPQETKKNLQVIIDKVRAANPETEIILAGMQIPPSMGADYTGRFKAIFSELAEENELYFVPFLLEGVAGNPALNLGDGIHPTAEGQKILAQNVWNILEKIVMAQPAR